MGKRKRGRPYIDKVPLSSQRLDEALTFAGVSLRVLDTDPTLNASEKTIRRAKKEGKINPEILDRLGKRLNVDPYFLQGLYDTSADNIATSIEEGEEIKSQIKVEDHPYLLQMQREQKPMQYVKELLLHNDIDLKQLDSLSKQKEISLYLELDRATSKILRKYFTPFRSSIHNYTIPMPPEEEIVKL